MNKLLLFIFILSLLIPMTFGTTVNIRAEVYKTHTEFTYLIDLGNKNVNSFSIEKLKDSKVVEANSNLEKLTYTTAGDFYIFKVKEDRANKFNLKLSSELASEQIFEKKSFIHYVSFNFPIDNLTFEVILEENIGEVKEAFPRNFKLSDEGGIIWNQNNIKDDTLFLLNFENLVSNPKKPQSEFSYLILLLFLPILLFIILFYIVKKSPKEENVKTKKSKKVKKEKLKENLNKTKIEEKSKIQIEEESKYEEIMNKYLTENEKEIVKLVNENQGISQYDILNYLPHFSKSNLSKIISKLHVKKILNRIRVGKVNKIYFGERLEEDIEDKNKE